MSELFLEEFFNQLRNFKKYPKYQYERRIDGFIGFFLPAVLKTKFSINVTSIIPEFPVKAHPEYRLSNNIDYMIFDKPNCNITFVELKTDSGSVSEDQLIYYIKTLNTPWKEIKGHIEWIKEGSNQKRKYEFLLDQLKDISESVKMNAIYLAPAKAKPSYKSRLKAAYQKVGIEFEKEQSRWEFLSLEEFADSKVEPQYQIEWQHIAKALKEI